MALDVFQFAEVLPYSICISLLALLKAWIELTSEAREREISVMERVLQLWRMGGAVKNLKVIDLKDAGYTPFELHSAGFSAQQVMEAGYMLAQLREAGYTLAQLKECGFTAEQRKQAGFTPA